MGPPSYTSFQFMNSKKPIFFTTNKKKIPFQNSVNIFYCRKSFRPKIHTQGRLRSSDKYRCVSGSKFLDISEENWFFVEESTISFKKKTPGTTHPALLWKDQAPLEKHWTTSSWEVETLLPFEALLNPPQCHRVASSRPQFSAMPLLVKTRSPVVQMLMLIFQFYLHNSYSTV